MNVALPAADQVHLWRMDIAALPAACERALAPEELIKRAEFVHAADQTRYARVRGALRLLLSRYLAIDPLGLVIRATADHKPFLAPEQGRGLTFSVSHSTRTAMFAVARQERVGVDVEDSPLRFAFDEVVDFAFADAEAAELRAAPTEQRERWFLRGWTRKEAMAKAAGSGFLVDPRTIGAPLDGAGAWRMDAAHVFGALSLVDVSDGAAVAALAADRIGARPALWSFQEFLADA